MSFPYTFPFYFGGTGLTDEELVVLYRDQLQKLMPPGRALNRIMGSDLTSWLLGFSVELSRIHNRVLDAYTESFPRTSVERLDEWEDLCGLPNECTYQLTDIDDRRTEVMRKFAVDLGQSETDFQTIASEFGYNLDIGTYTTSRCGVARCGDPLHGDAWLYGGRFSFEEQGVVTDTVLPCLLNEHRHIHTHINFNSYDSTIVDSLPGLSHHFVPGEFVEANGVIASWTNRAAGDDFVQTLADANTCVAIKREEFAGCGGWNETTDTPLTMGGLNIRNDGSENSATLIKSGNCTLFMAVSLSSMEFGLNAVLLQNASGTFRVHITGGGPYILNVSRGGTTYQRPLPSNVFVVTYADDGGDVALRVNEELTGVQSVGAAPTQDDLSIGDGAPFLFDTSFHGALLEVIACDYVGLPGANSAVDDVTSYLVGKYGAS